MSEPMTERRKHTTSGVMPTIRGHDEKTTDIGIVEHAGLEPATLCLQSRCATNCANAPPPRHEGGKEVGKTPPCRNTCGTPRPHNPIRHMGAA